MESDGEPEGENPPRKRCTCCRCACCIPCSRCCRKRQNTGPRSAERERVSIQLPVDEPDGPTKSERCLACFKKSTAFLFSTIGLTSLMVAYTIFGGFIFKELEGQFEQQIRHQLNNERKNRVEQLWNMTVLMNVFYKKNWTSQADQILKNYTTIIHKATKEQGWDGKDGETDAMWTFAGSLLYSITVITTIGYGHIAPRTDWGRVVTMLYAMIGIPVTLLCLANLGGFMATAFRYLYNNICCGLCCICRRRKRMDPEMRAAAMKYMNVKNGEPGVTRALTSEEDELPGSLENSPEKLPMAVYLRIRARRALRIEEIKHQTVPIPVSLIVLVSYILSGAWLFAWWENWDYLKGSYFCFITLTTIGFGDVVPGTSIDSWSQQAKLVSCALYLVFGLAIIAMCFELMQEEVRNKCRAIGKKIGLLE